MLSSVTEPSPSAAATRPWSIALSGGGHRAALFGLGALLYLADAGLLPSVSSIASVSGGSITNGVVAKELDVNTARSDTLRGATKNLLRRCTYSGSVQSSPWLAPLVSGLVVSLAAIASGTLGAIVAVLAGLAEASWWRPTALGFVIAAAAGLALFAAILAPLSRFADWRLDQLFFGGIELRSLAARPVTHVFCTTELQTRLHAYLSPRFVYAHGYDRADSVGPVRLSTAVQASACFPPVFPPRRLRLPVVGFNHGPGDRMWLTDGGVYDNMADEWARGLVDAASRRKNDAVMGEVPQKLLVVNASTEGGAHRAPWLAKLPLLGSLLPLKAESDVMYQQTTAIRRSDLFNQFRAAQTAPTTAVTTAPHSEPLRARGAGAVLPSLGGALVHIGTSAMWPTLYHRAPPGADEATWRTVCDGLRTLNGTDGAVDEAAHVAAGVSTTLGKIGRDKAVALLWHGYLLTMVNFALFHGGPWQPAPRQDFCDLVDAAK
jgi:predicted acylesterase/phospholipase RssA